MIYVVEVVNEQGATATKEYEAHSLGDVLHMAEIDLWEYPELHVINVQPAFKQSAVAKRADW